MCNPAIRNFLVSGLLALLSAESLQAKGVKLSFLGEEIVLQDTLSLLTNNGCSAPATAVLRSAVLNYFTVDFDIDLSKFPKPQSGSYSFASMQKLVEALPVKAFESKHPFGINCFDVVISLAASQLKVNLRPDEIAGTLLVPLLNTNTQPAAFIPAGAATPRDAFNALYQTYYRDETEKFFPRSQQDSRICLTAALYRCRFLPKSASQQNLARTALQVLTLDWQRDGLKFPSQIELVLVHGVRWGEMCTEHAGLLISRTNGYTYIEKSGIKGPFVRLDFDKKSELMLWLAAIWKSCELHDAHLATINDGLIERLDTSQK